MTVLTYLCFLKGSVRSRDFVSLIADGLIGFDPADVSWMPGRPRRRGLDKQLAELSSIDRIQNASVRSSDGRFRFELSGIAGWPAQIITMTSPDVTQDNLILRSSTIPGFTCALVGDADDVYWQTERQISAFELANRPWKSLPLVWDDVFDEYQVDTSQNPGRQSPAPGMWLWAAREMWFGPLASTVIGLDRLNDLPRGVECVDDLRKVTLFDSDEDLSEIRARQAEFRSVMRYDELEREAPLLASQATDPIAEVVTGEFPNGATRRLVEWYSSGRRAPRSAADEARVAEFDDSNRILLEEVVPAASPRCGH